MKVDWKKITNLKVWYIAAFIITALLSTYLYEEDSEPNLLWLPFLVGVVGYIHFKYFHKL